MRVGVLGAGLWAPGWPDVATCVSGGRVEGADAPAIGLLPPATARRSTFLARVAADVLAQALQGTGLDPAGLGLVLGTGGGELRTTFEVLELVFETPPASSPLRFRNSVHNAALGHLSIALGATGYASALAADPDVVVAMALLEGALRVAVHGELCAVVVADETWPGSDFDPLGAAVLLGPVDAPGVRGWITLDRGEAPVGGAPPARLAGNPVVQVLDLVRALSGGRAARVAVSRDPDERPWRVDWEPV